MTTSFIKSIASLAALAVILTASAAFAGNHGGGNQGGGGNKMSSSFTKSSTPNISSFKTNSFKINTTNNTNWKSNNNFISNKNLNLISNKDHVNTNTLDKHISNNVLHKLNNNDNHPKFDLKKDNHLFDKKKDFCKYPWFDCKKSYCWDNWCYPYYFGCYYPSCYDYCFSTCSYPTYTTYTPVYETVNYTPALVPAPVEVARTRVAIGSTLLINGQAFGNAAGGARLRITSMALPIQVVEWTPAGVKVMVPPVELTGVTLADIEIVRPDGSLAAKLPVELIPSPEQLAIGR